AGDREPSERIIARIILAAGTGLSRRCFARRPGPDAFAGDEGYSSPEQLSVRGESRTDQRRRREALCYASPRSSGHPGRIAVAGAHSYVGSMSQLLNTGCLGHIPEIVDGDAPHQERGFDAQAWAATEALRVWKLLRR